MIKRLLSFCLILVLIFPTGVSVWAQEGEGAEIELGLSDACYVRNHPTYKDTALGGSILVVDSTSSIRMSFIKYDFADYAESIDDMSKITLRLAAQDAENHPQTNFTLYIMPDSMENWSSSTLTWTAAEQEDMTASGVGELLYTSGTLKNKVPVETADISEAVKKHLKENPSNTEVTFKLSTSLNAPYVICGVGSGYDPVLKLTQAVNFEKIVKQTYDELTFDKISSDDPSSVTSPLEFVTTGAYGTTITWSSSDEDTVNSSTGMITRPSWGNGDKTVTLTALIENEDFSLTKDFEITVPESGVYPDEMLLEVNCYASDSTFVRGGDSFKDTVVNTGNIVVDARASGATHRMGFAGFDFTGMEEYLENANSMQLRLDVTNDAVAENNNNFVVYVLPDELEDIDASSLTYTIAQQSGLLDYTDNLVHIEGGVLPSASYRTGDILSAIMDNLNSSDNKTVWIKVASTAGAGYTIYGAGASETLKPAMIIKYPKPACDLDLITLDLPQVTDSDMELPTTGSFGSSITWESSDPSLIANDGTVNAAEADEDYSKEDSVVNLKATATSDGNVYEKEFTVRVRRKGVIDADSDITASEEEIVADEAALTLGGTSGHIPVISFDVSEQMAKIQNSRKTVLKLYGADGYEGMNITAVPVTDSSLKSLDLNSLTYTDAQNMAENADGYSVTASFGGKAYAVLDVTEYMHSVQDGKAMFALVTDGPRFSLVSADGALNSEPKLIVSPIEYTDEYAANLVAENITFDILTDDAIDAVRKSLTLPTSGRFGSVIEWTSGNEDVINPATGEVSRPKANTRVTLTAHVTVGEVTVKKTFELTVIKEETDAEYAAYLASTLAPDGGILTSSIVLKGETMEDGAVVSWESSEPYEAKVNGFNLEIIRPSGGDLTVSLTATVTYKGKTASETYNVTVVRSANKNILRNRKVTQGDADAAKAIDENIDTVWEISNPSVTVDMGSARVISGMTLVPEVSSFDGLTISVSDDMYQWKKAFSGGSLAAGKLNYITFDPIAYGRYVKFDFPSHAKAVSFIAAYNFVDESADDVFADITVPTEAKKNFELTESLYGNTITWESSSKVITIDGNTAEVNPSTSGKNVTLTAEVEINGEKYTKSYVVYVPGSGSSGGGGGGGGSKSSGGLGLVAAPPAVNTAPTQPVQKGFTDLYLAAWAADYINYLAGKGIVNGKSETIFAPNDNLKREEMAKIITLAFSLSESQNASGFVDVNENAWYAPYVASLKENGITRGMGDGTFGVNLDITRQDAFTMIASVIGCDTSSADKTSFNDDAMIADYARGSINALISLGILSGDENGNVNPTAKITRAEIAKVICLAIGNK